MKIVEILKASQTLRRLSFKRFFEAVLILGALQVSMPHPALAAIRCEALFHEHESKIVVSELLRFVDDVSRSKSLRNPTVEILFERLRNNAPEFAAMGLRRYRSLDSLTIDQKANLLIAYHEQFFNRFRDVKKLSWLRNRSLQNGLRQHGYRAQTLDAKVELKSLSAENIARIVRRTGLREPLIRDREIEAILEQVDLRIFRNAHHQDVSSGTILSSQRLKDYGLEGGANSIQTFNRKFLKSDDQIYFFIKFRAEGSAPESSQYGQAKQELKIAEAQDDLWISPYVMYPDDLVKFAKRALPAYRRSDLDTTFVYELEDSKVEPQTMTKIRDELHGFDFTYADFRNLTRLQLRKSLTALKYNPLSRLKFGLSFSSAKALLLNQLPDVKTDDAIDALIMRPLGLPRMEAKIPVALDAAAVSAR